MAFLHENNGAPLANSGLNAFKNMPTRRQRREALRFFEKMLADHCRHKQKHGLYSYHEKRTHGA